VVGEEGRVEVTLPSLKHISSVTPIRVTETTFSVWTEFERSCELRICLYGKVYTAILGPSDFDGYDDIKHVVTIAGKEVVAVTADTKRDALTPNFSSGPVDLTNYDSEWNTEYIHAMAHCVTAGAVDKVGELTLNYVKNVEERHSLADIGKAIQILPVAANVWIFLEHLPKKMGVEQWRAAADSAGKMETIYLKGVSEEVSEGWGKEIGRLITRAKKATTENIKFQDSFVQGVLQGLGEDEANCEEIEISWWESGANEEIVKMMEQLTWDNTWDGRTLLCVKK